mmetsp:Transcript_61838/g.139973  ORF Transcript_61838/g.139973 Transcript_61838/m.139973 type:complete len:248 (-) Transcript_61838:638-1381(-)
MISWLVGVALLFSESSLAGTSTRWLSSNRELTLSSAQYPGVLFFFFYIPHPRGRSYDKPFANKLCYLSKHNLTLFMDVVDMEAGWASSLAHDTSRPMGPTWLKPYSVVRALDRMENETGYLAYMDLDLIIKNSNVDFQQRYITGSQQADLTVTDHNIALNNGAFILRNSAFGRLFVRRWAEINSSNEGGRLPFSDNGSFIEAILSFLPSYQGASKECLIPTKADTGKLLNLNTYMACFYKHFDAAAG